MKNIIIGIGIFVICFIICLVVFLCLPERFDLLQVDNIGNMGELKNIKFKDDDLLNRFYAKGYVYISSNNNINPNTWGTGKWGKYIGETATSLPAFWKRIDDDFIKYTTTGNPKIVIDPIDPINKTRKNTITFTENGTFNITTMNIQIEINLYMVGGGGGGSNAYVNGSTEFNALNTLLKVNTYSFGGGGGGGEVINAVISSHLQNTDITVGKGGKGGNNNGGNSIFNTTNIIKNEARGGDGGFSDGVQAAPNTTGSFAKGGVNFAKGADSGKGSGMTTNSIQGGRSGEMIYKEKNRNATSTGFGGDGGDVMGQNVLPGGNGANGIVILTFYN